MRRAALFPLLLVLFVALQGCAPALQEAQRPRYFWPPIAEDAKIEYLGFYASEANLKGALFTNLAEIVLGVEVAKPLFIHPFAVDARGDKVLITDTSSRRVFLLDLKRRTLASTSIHAHDQKTFGFPAGVAFLNDKEFLVVDSVARRVDRYGFDTNLRGFFGDEQLTRPTAVAVDHRHQRIAVVDPAEHRLALFTFDGSFVGYLGKRGTGPGEFNFPLDADFDRDGNLFVLDSMNFRVQRFARDGDAYRYVSHFGETGTAAGSFLRPKSLAVTPSGHVYVTDALGHKVIVFDRDGTFLLTFGGKFVATDGKFAPGGLYMPNGIAADDQDGIWVVDTLNRMVHHFQYLNENYLRDHPILPGEFTPVDLGAPAAR
jgi:sugar lactone lactonase YvrE